MKAPVDLIVRNTSEVLTLAGPNRPRLGAEMSRLEAVPAGAVAINNGRIIAVAPAEEISGRFSAESELDARGGLVTPGLVDPHTHLVFAGSRADEMQRKIAGESYLDILRSGGGIHATVRAVRAADEEVLLSQARRRLDQLLAHGTTTVEIKTGYGLSPEAELKLLRVIERLQKTHPVDVVSTFLGAHIVPADQPRRAYLEWLDGEALRMAKPFARFFDVFCETEAFSAAETERLLQAALAAGFRLKVHAGQFHSLGAAGIAADLGAASVDHCEHLSDDEIERMRRAGIVAVLLPGATFFTGGSSHADAVKLIERGIPVAVATDFNPGSCPCFSMQMIVALACIELKMTAAQALTAATINAAFAIDQGDRIGSLEPGKQADLVVWQIDKLELLPYHFGGNLLRTVLKKGAEIGLAL